MSAHAARRLRESHAGERLVVDVAPGEDATRALDEARAITSSREVHAGPCVAASPGGAATWLKAGPLSPSGARRHGRRALLGLPTPRQAELAHLVWLEARLFRVPRPRFAVAVLRRGRVLYQALATTLVAEAAPFEAANRDAAPHDRLALAEELGRELGRMHALGFLHADLYPRNVLVAPREHGDPAGRRLVWLDCWAGGPGHGDRGLARPLARDLGTWFAWAVDAWSARERRACLAAYVAARRENGRAVVSLARLAAGLTRERRRELRRLERDPRRLRGARFPRAGYDVAEELAGLIERANGPRVPPLEGA